MRHRGRAADERLDTTQRRRQAEDSRRRRKRERLRFTAAHAERDDAAEAAHLTLRKRVLRMRREARIVDFRDVVVTLEKRRDRTRILLVFAHAQRQCFRAAHGQIRIPRPRDRADGVLVKRNLRMQVGIVRDHDAADDVAVTAEVFRRRVHHDVGPEFQGPLPVRRCERVVDRDDLPRRFERRDRRDVDDSHEGIRRRLDPQQLRLGANRRARRRDVAHVDVRRRDAIARKDVGEEPVRPAVEIFGRDDMVARAQEAQRRSVRRSHARTEGSGVARAFEIRELFLERGARRIARTRVVESLRPPDRLLRERGRLIDGDDRRTGGTAGFLSRADRARCESASSHGSLGRSSARSRLRVAESIIRHESHSTV